MSRSPLLLFVCLSLCHLTIRKRGLVPLVADIDPAAPLLVFDSGVGGLSVLAEVRRLLPGAPVVYAADNAGLPYGDKSEAQIAARVAGLLGRMTERLRPSLVCIA